MPSVATTEPKIAPNFNEYFRNGKSFSAFCRARYGQSRLVWRDTTLWRRVGLYAIAFDLKAADERFTTIDQQIAETREQSRKEREERVAFVERVCKNSATRPRLW